MMSSNERFSVSSSFRLRIRFRNARSSAESFDGFWVRDIAVADLPLTSLIAQNQAFIAWCAIALRLGRRRQGIFLLPFIAAQLCGRLDHIAMRERAGFRSRNTTAKDAFARLQNTVSAT